MQRRAGTFNEKGSAALTNALGNLAMEYLGFRGGDFSSVQTWLLNRHVNNSTLEDIQKALNAIRGDLKREDAGTKLAALELIMGTSQSVVAMTRKLATPKIKTRNVIMPREKVIKVEPQQQKVKKKKLEPGSFEPIKPKPPLPNQRIGID